MIPSDSLDQVTGCSVLEDNILNCSDHYPVFMDFAIGRLLPTTVKSQSLNMPKWNKVSITDLKTLYTNKVDSEMTYILNFVRQVDSKNGIDKAIEMVVSTLLTAGKSIPSSKFRPNLKPFWNSELSELKVIKVAKFKEWVAKGKPRDLGDPYFAQHKKAKKDFTRGLRRISKEYENRQMIEAIESSSVDKAIFWQHLKRCRSPAGSRVLAIKNKRDKVVYEINEILNVWRGHFSTLSTPKDDPSYDQEHFIYVNTQRALYVQCTYIVRTVGTMYVQCTYIVRTVPAG